MKKTLILIFTMLFTSIYSQTASTTWKFYSDPMGDNSYAYVNLYEAGGRVDYNMLKYTKEGGFIWTECNLSKYYYSDGSKNYLDIVVKFKVGKNIIDLESYFKEQYPNYQEYSLNVIKGSGKFCMGEGRATDELKETMVELLKKASLVTFDFDIYGGQKARKYVSASGFSLSYSKF